MAHDDSVNLSIASEGSGFQRTRIAKADTEAGWLEQRAPYLGASTAAVLFGEHPFKSLAQLARERRTGARQPDNAAMMRGRFLEDGVARWWSHVHCTPITEVSELYVCNEVLVATLDRILTELPVILEVKTTSQRVHDVERYWYWQCQAQLACTGYERVEVAVLDQSMSLQSFTVLPDHDAQQRLVDEATSFLERLKDEREMFTEQTVPPNSVELSANTRALVRAWRFAQSHADTLDADIGLLKGMIDRALGASDSGTVNGNEVVRRMHRTYRNNLDITRLRTEQPEVAKEYAKAPTTSSFLVLR